MEKKYQIFISSTYKDLMEERRKVQDTILSMNHFPVGMELFSAEDDEQWEVIKRTIDTSDYYVLIIGHRYGSVIKSGEDAGISYTEKEFRYALSIGLPVHVFLISEEAMVRAADVETDPEKKRRLDLFKQEAATGRTVEWWINKEDLAAKVMNSLYKKFSGSTRPGWIRGSAIDMEKTLQEMTSLSERNRALEEENRKLLLEIQRYEGRCSERMPQLTVYLEADFGNESDSTFEELYRNAEHFSKEEDGNIVLSMQRINTNLIEAEYAPVSKTDFVGELRGRVSDPEIEEYNRALPDKQEMEKYMAEYVAYARKRDCGIPIRIFVRNDGSAKATDISVTLEFPEELEVLEMDDWKDIKAPKKPEKPRSLIEIAYERAHAGETSLEKMYAQLGLLSEQSERRFLVSFLSPPGENSVSESVAVSDNTLYLEWKDGILHTKSDDLGGVYLAALAEGEYSIRVTVMCAEYAEPEIGYIRVSCRESDE